MSKGNVVLGYGRGAVGDIVLTRLKGQQVAKARNRNPNNPRTSLQMKQRAGFIAPLKFYTRGIQNLFQFAFTDKRLKESDYNAFMRINVGEGFPLTPDEFRKPGFPALGSWVMSRGTLVAPPVMLAAVHSNTIGLRMKYSYDTHSSMANLSDDLITDFGLKLGDIITLVMIRADGVVTQARDITVDEGAQVKWFIQQFRIDKKDTRTIGQALPLVEITSLEDGYYLGISASTAQINETTVGMACICSRITSKGLQVSTSRLVMGGYADDYVDYRNTPSEIQRVLAEWGASQGAILKGSLL